MSGTRVSKSGYDAWRTRRPSTCAQENARLEVAIQAAHVRRRQTYGSERLQAELPKDGFPAGIRRIKRLRKKQNIRCTPVQRFTITMDLAHPLPVAENRLMQTFTTTRPNETWVVDITYSHHGGRLVVSRWHQGFVQDCKVVSHAMGARMTTALVIQVLGPQCGRTVHAQA